MSDDSSDASGQHLVIERTLDAPPEVVWEMWTQPEHFGQWYGPTGTSIAKAEMDVRVGGVRLVCMEMTTPDGTMRMWFTGEYLEVVENQRLVYTDAMSDEHGNVLSADLARTPPGHPVTTQVRVDLEPVAGGTRMTLTHVGIPAGSPGARGWAAALDNLAAHLHDTDRA
jgi:uncharacterized protein YndB with AHSA1/START domain